MTTKFTRTCMYIYGLYIYIYILSVDGPRPGFLSLKFHVSKGIFGVVEASPPEK